MTKWCMKEILPTDHTLLASPLHEKNPPISAVVCDAVLTVTDLNFFR